MSLAAELKTGLVPRITAAINEAASKAPKTKVFSVTDDQVLAWVLGEPSAPAVVKNAAAAPKPPKPSIEDDDDEVSVTAKVSGKAPAASAGRGRAKPAVTSAKAAPGKAAAKQTEDAAPAPVKKVVAKSETTKDSDNEDDEIPTAPSGKTAPVKAKPVLKKPVPAVAGPAKDAEDDDDTPIVPKASLAGPAKKPAVAASKKPAASVTKAMPNKDEEDEDEEVVSAKGTTGGKPADLGHPGKNDNTRGPGRPKATNVSSDSPSLTVPRKTDVDDSDSQEEIKTVKYSKDGSLHRELTTNAIISDKDDPKKMMFIGKHVEGTSKLQELTPEDLALLEKFGKTPYKYKSLPIDGKGSGPSAKEEQDDEEEDEDDE